MTSECSRVPRTGAAEAEAEELAWTCFERRSRSAWSFCTCSESVFVDKPADPDDSRSGLGVLDLFFRFSAGGAGGAPSGGLALCFGRIAGRPSSTAEMTATCGARIECVDGEVSPYSSSTSEMSEMSSEDAGKFAILSKGSDSSELVSSSNSRGSGWASWASRESSETKTTSLAVSLCSNYDAVIWHEATQGATECPGEGGADPADCERWAKASASEGRDSCKLPLCSCSALSAALRERAIAACMLCWLTGQKISILSCPGRTSERDWTISQS